MSSRRIYSENSEDTRRQAKYKIAVLINSSLMNDYRVIKTINTLESIAELDIIFPAAAGDQFPDFEHAKLYPVPMRNSLRYRLLRHSLFGREFLYLLDGVPEGASYDFIWANDLPTLIPAMQLAEKHQAELIYDSHEIYLETLNQFLPIKASFPKSVVVQSLLSVMRSHGRKIEARALRQAFLFVTVNRSLLDYFKEHYAVGDSLVMMNFPRKKINALIPVDLKARFNWSRDSFVFLYQGTLNPGRGLELVIQSILEAPKEFKLVVIGNGPLKNRLKQIAKFGDGPERIQFIDEMTQVELPSFIEGADAGFNLLEDINLSKKLASPNKLFEYIRSGIPVLCSKTIENRRVIERFPLGIMVDNQVESIIAGMIRLRDGVTFRKELFKEATETYSWERQEGELLEKISA